MLAVTDLAAAQLAEMLDGVERADGDALRLVEQGDRTLSITLGQVQLGDQVISHEQRPVLLIESDLAAALEGATLDATDGPQGSKLTLIPPIDGGMASAR